MTIQLERGEEQEASVFREVTSKLIKIGCNFYDRGWLYGTSGNLSSVLSREPMRIAITATGADKGDLSTSQIIEVDGEARVTRGSNRPSSETHLHLSVIRNRNAGAVFHTHSIWSTILSKENADRRGIELKEYEMLKGLGNVSTHEHSEWLPILKNSQDIRSLALEVEDLLDREPGIHCFMLAGHGLYTWGNSIEDAKRHVEVLEFLLEVTGRMRTGANS